MHFYSGALVGPFILIAALTGALYALAPTIERVVYGDVITVEPGPAALPLSQQAAVARAAFPDLEMSGMRPAPTPDGSTRVYFTDRALGEDDRRAVFVDPYSGRVLGDEVSWFGSLPLSTWLDGLHRNLQLGEPGRIYSELAASWLSVIALGGLYLWFARSRTERRRARAGSLLTVDRRVTGRARTLNWHGATGVWVLAALLFLSATGITWSTYAGANFGAIQAALNSDTPELDTALAGSQTPAGTGEGHQGHGQMPEATERDAVGSIDFDQAVKAANDAGVTAPVEVDVPAEPGHAIGVTEVDLPYRLTSDAVAVDPATGTVTSAVDYWRDYPLVAKLTDWGIRGHMGNLFGLLNQFVLLCVAAGLLTVIVRGYRMWWQRRPTRGSDWAVGRPPLRGGIRRLHPAAVAGIVVATVALGWFLPLLGISLAAFLVVDLAIGAVKAHGVR